MGEEKGLVVAGSKLVVGVFIADRYFVISSLVYQNYLGYNIRPYPPHNKRRVGS